MQSVNRRDHGRVMMIIHVVEIKSSPDLGWIKRSVTSIGLSIGLSPMNGN